MISLKMVFSNKIAWLCKTTYILISCQNFKNFKLTMQFSTLNLHRLQKSSKIPCYYNQFSIVHNWCPQTLHQKSNATRCSSCKKMFSKAIYVSHDPNSICKHKTIQFNKSSKDYINNRKTKAWNLRLKATSEV